MTSRDEEFLSLDVVPIGIDQQIAGVLLLADQVDRLGRHADKAIAQRFAGNQMLALWEEAGNAAEA